MPHGSMMQDLDNRGAKEPFGSKTAYRVSWSLDSPK